MGRKLILCLKKKKLDKLEKEQEIGWFVADQFLNLGMVGTLIGFILMLNGGFTDMDVTNVSAMQNVIAKIALGM